MIEVKLVLFYVFKYIRFLSVNEANNRSFWSCRFAFRKPM